jgi:aldose 1-epimerase
LPGVTFSWRGRDHALEAGDGRGNAIHGFVHTRPWQVTLQEDQRVQGRFRAAKHLENHQALWPADFEIQANYELTGNVLRFHARMTNTDPKAELPCGLGLHPYFRVPLSTATDGVTADDCIVRIHATRHWPLQDMLPLGHSVPWAQAESMRQGQRFADLQMDDVLGGLPHDDQGICRAVIRDPAHHRQVTLSFDQAFANCVAYTPPHRRAICIEPYSCVPGAWLLDQAAEAGAKILAPGESWEANMWIEADSLA